MEGVISSEIRSTNGTHDSCQETVQETSSEHSQANNPSPWTLRKLIILASICLVYFVVFGAYSVYSPFFPSEARDKGVSGTIVGLIFGTYSFTVFLFCPLCGMLIPKYGPRFVVLTGMFLCGGSLALFGFCGMMPDRTVFIVFCFVLRATSAIGGAACETAAMSILLEEFPNNVGAVTGAVETFCGIGFSVGPVLGGVLYTVGGFKLPFIVMGSAMIAALPFLFFMISNKKGSQDDAEESISMLQAFRVPAIFVLALSYVACGALYGYIEPIIGPHLKQMGENPTQIGLVFLLYAGIYAISQPLLGWIGDKTKCYRSMLVFGYIGIGVGYLLLGPAPFLPFLPAKKLWLFCVAMLVSGLVAGVPFVPIMPDLVRAARANGMPDNSSTNAVLSSIFGSMYYLGATIGPTIAGISEEHFGFEWAMSIASFISFCQALVIFVFTLCENVPQRSNPTPADREPLFVNS